MSDFRFLPGDPCEAFDGDAQCTLHDLTLHRDTLKATALLRWNGPVGAGRLNFGSINLLSSTTRSSFAKPGRERVAEFDWDGFMLKIACDADEWIRTGDEPSSVSDVEIPDRGRWLLPPIMEMEPERPDAVAAAGGSFKSFIAAAMAYTIVTDRNVLGLGARANGPVLYADWEASRVTFARRVRAIAAGSDGPIPPDLSYTRLSVPLTQAHRPLARRIRELEAVAVFVDSKGYAIAGDLIDAGVTMQFYAALNQMGVPVFLVDHVAADQKGAPKRGFGSIYNENGIRNGWVALKGEPHDGVVPVKWTHEKQNNGPKLADLAWELRFVNDDHDELRSVAFKQVAANRVVTVAQREDMALSDKIKHILEVADRSREELYALLPGEKRASVQKALRRMADRQEAVSADNSDKFRLVGGQERPVPYGDSG